MIPGGKSIVKIHAAVVAVSAVAVYFVSPQMLVAFLAGALLVTINFFVLTVIWRRIFDKKPVATTIGLIVIKYSILGALLYFFVMKLRLPMLPLLAGVATLGGSFLITALRTQIEKR